MSEFGDANPERRNQGSGPGKEKRGMSPGDRKMREAAEIQRMQERLEQQKKDIDKSVDDLRVKHSDFEEKRKSAFEHLKTQHDLSEDKPENRSEEAIAKRNAASSNYESKRAEIDKLVKEYKPARNSLLPDINDLNSNIDVHNSNIDVLHNQERAKQPRFQHLKVERYQEVVPGDISSLPEMYDAKRLRLWEGHQPSPQDLHENPEDFHNRLLESRPE